MSLEVDIRKRVNGFTLDAAWCIGDELAVLFGYSGAGKSMTLQAVAGLSKPDSGSVLLRHQVLFSSVLGVNVPPRKRQFGYVFQDLALFPHMTVEKNLMYGGAELSGDERAQRCRELVHLFSLGGLEKKYPSEISGGQKQRVGLARALMRRPAALLLDEPFNALDGPIRRDMQRILKETAREFPMPVVLVTHDLAEASFLADTMILYAGGRVVQFGSPEEVILKPSCPEVQNLIAAGCAAGCRQ